MTLHLSTGRFIAMLTCASCALGAPAQSQEPRELPPSAILEQAGMVRDATSLVGLAKSFVVEGEQLYDSHFLGAERLVFKPGARLIFSDTALKGRNNLIVAAQTIVSDDQSQPGTITWQRGDGPDSPAPISGQAGTGLHGQRDGQAGGRGGDGARGNPGVPGRNAPNLIVFVTRVEGAPPVIDLHGQDGGKGGIGQQGGSGGVGHKGRPSAQTAIECKRGPGRGGNGGDGGNGGPGGIGGYGGDGGTVTLASLPDAFPALLQLTRTNVSGGEGGVGGDGGPGGLGGPGGRAGEKADPWCKARRDRDGKSGSNGQQGLKGENRESGTQGDVFFTTLTAEQFKRLFGG